MNSRSIEEILSKLSIKFNRIFCEKEFVCCVCEDLQRIIKNENKCCVLIFPILSPNYLRVVRYQAKLSDLAVISLGSGSAKSVGICQKKFLLYSESEEKYSKNFGSQQMAENSNSTRKKRPPIQLYVPPAQRKPKQNEKKIIQKDRPQIAGGDGNESLSFASREKVFTPCYLADAVFENEELYTKNHIDQTHPEAFDIDCLTEPESPKKSEATGLVNNKPDCPTQDSVNIISVAVNKSKQIDNVIVLEENTEPVKTSPKISKEPKTKKNEHEQEKEIMRKAKQNINRKTRPIIKYIEDDNTLKIGKNDNVNNWEDLFDENGELEEEIFTEIIQKVGPTVTIAKAEEDYSAYTAKQIEELEHMVELHDFPATMETQDLISAFSELNSDSMYVKWVDDTHAILVLGSSTQAQKAMAISNPFIKVRPMSAASNLTLEKANQFDLKPAMRRPETNLQTARRLITSHLGAKSQISKEQSAKERENLKAAKELKKQTRQNEKDAWEGNLKSTVN
ncbi:coiled-coil domain-containing protein R3HCC1L isoform X1 [Sitophilus oryzae]|uniref:Coiled-coil domain-containing protein R3HCC1L isoform X1 n=2 Tax=Sitophilus oryzae TaxID=7048 RepID=A0A6J2XXK9_SITOR|nr:coiled-coil domain-containing protein R3HCC1L isoform X1 [Sitophilus oryzae]XP_030756248.1 coiled-coil domain-containing protein R3HCC1L isoform X1 [Sitophilus oryzae]